MVRDGLAFARRVVPFAFVLFPTLGPTHLRRTRANVNGRLRKRIGCFPSKVIVFGAQWRTAMNGKMAPRA